jgi:malonyl-CoA/methylmalonyl-CoA synthetase
VPSLGNSSEGEEVKDSVSFGNIVAEVKRISSAVEGENPALILYTSGTTGKPKGVVHTHASIGAQVRMLAESWEYTASDRFLHCLPLHHILNHLKFQFYFCSSDINIEALPYRKGFDFP